MIASTSAAVNPASGSSLLRQADLIFIGALFATVLMLIVPVPPFVLDMLLAVSITMSLLVLLVIIYVRAPAEFSGFPTILLGLTLYRLALNICSTRLILTKGYAGGIIDSFGHFVIQGNYIVGFVVFVILVVINFVVITKGAGRIAEVSARFTLDALPGKQMAIDAELNAGIIDEAAATARRTKIQKEADFYGAMDGASKFVRGDAIAGILITLVNVIGGFAIGVFQMDLTLTESLTKFTLLSIGDGLVAQIPALIVSVAAGLLVTRAAEDENLGAQVGRQLLRYPRALQVVGGMMMVFGLIPGMPFWPFALLGGLLFYVARSIPRLAGEGGEKPFKGAAKDAAGGESSPAGGSAPAGGARPGGGAEDIRKLTDVDLFAVEVGYGLLPLADAKQGGDLLARITGARKTLARDRGLVVPPISVRDNLELESNAYRFLLRGRVLAGGTVSVGEWLAMNVSGSQVKLRGKSCKEPVFGIDAVWVPESERTTAEINGYTVVDAASVIVTHLTEALKGAAHHLLGRQDVQGLVDHIKTTHPALVAELLPDLVNLGIIQRVLQNLLRESVPILNLPVILEGVADFAPVTKNPDELSELVRRNLGMYFVHEYESRPGVVRAVTMDPRMEQLLISKIHRAPGDISLALDASVGRHLLAEVMSKSKPFLEAGQPAVLVVGADLRLALRRFLEPSFPRLTVLAYQEIPAGCDIESAGTITLPAGVARAETKAT
ncbi:flagellar biosynthesis protein FlhA [Termitidicoccus mucosus]|uniref:Flagellar biosynthesis protein FlhA n=1 Tax=Termitidicoccus mucosus TaxID=1184151 RepID=A0A178IF41_9BACT|nr:flagellar biosynthesis protein FlhA [Opitutaceae bacterium TSB47]